MTGKYVADKTELMLMSLMKAHGVRKIIASPGTTNVGLIASMQRDSFFEIYSSVDERSAAYIACGLAEESGEPVALSCTQATASRNYYPGLTEAYYRKLPILAITSTQHAVRIGQNIQQAIDRSVQPVDTVRLSVAIPSVQNADDACYANIKINEALLELKRDGGGPVHINLTTTYTRTFDVDTLPVERVIDRIGRNDPLPELPRSWRIGVYVGAHSAWTESQRQAIDRFCERYDAVVFCDRISNYNGRWRVNPSLLFSQEQYATPALEMDLMIHIGNVSGAVTRNKAKRVWRVNPDGEIRDTFGSLTKVFEMSEEDFFSNYADIVEGSGPRSYFELCNVECGKISKKVPELPFSNPWIAQQTITRLPGGCILHLGIYNSLRSWNLFEPELPILGYSNTGGFGIDGGLSSLIGASLARTDLCFGVYGDLAFFYDLNSLGNRHVGNNLRIMLINNGCGVEFKEHINRAYMLGEEADAYIAARGHYGCKSKYLVKGYSESLGFKYLSASSKTEFSSHIDEFVSVNDENKSVLFEVFTDSEDEAEALKRLFNIESSAAGATKKAVKKLLGVKGTEFLKKRLS